MPILLDLPELGGLEDWILFLTKIYVMVKPRSTVSPTQCQRIPTPRNGATVVTATHSPVVLAFSPLRTTLAQRATKMRLLT